jgi:hypothetical protein
MVVCDKNGMVYDIWFHPASYHEVMSKWFRFLTENFEFIGDICEDKQEKSKTNYWSSEFSNKEFQSYK